MKAQSSTRSSTILFRVTNAGVYKKSELSQTQLEKTFVSTEITPIRQNTMQPKASTSKSSFKQTLLVIAGFLSFKNTFALIASHPLPNTKNSKYIKLVYWN